MTVMVPGVLKKVQVLEKKLLLLLLCSCIGIGKAFHEAGEQTFAVEGYILRTADGFLEAGSPVNIL